MWRLEMEKAQRKTMFWVFALILLCVVFVGGIFYSAVFFKKQVSRLYALIPVSGLEQRITAELVSLQYEVLNARTNIKNVEDIKNTMRNMENICDDYSERIGSAGLENNLINLDGFLRDFNSKYHKSSPDIYLAQISENIPKIKKFISKMSVSSDLESKFALSFETANKFIMAAMIIAFLTGEGIFIFAFIYFRQSRRHLSKIEDMMKTAVIDETSGLYNKAYFETRLLENLNRVERFKKPLSVVFIKLAYLNGTGSKNEKQLLAEAGKRIAKSTRIYDVNSRYVDSIFALLIHEAGIKETGIVVERLKKALETEKYVTLTRKNSIINLITGKHEDVRNLFNVQTVFGCVVCETGNIKIQNLLEKCGKTLDIAQGTKKRVLITSEPLEKQALKKDRRT
jgi:diguanylate cyclase (GGDEF)-like protein